MLSKLNWQVQHLHLLQKSTFLRVCMHVCGLLNKILIFTIFNKKFKSISISSYAFLFILKKISKQMYIHNSPGKFLKVFFLNLLETFPHKLCILWTVLSPDILEISTLSVDRQIGRTRATQVRMTSLLFLFLLPLCLHCFSACLFVALILFVSGVASTSPFQTPESAQISFSHCQHKEPGQTSTSDYCLVSHQVLTFILNAFEKYSKEMNWYMKLDVQLELLS